MGEPIKEMGFDFSNPNNICDADHAQFEVKVRGPKDKGVLYFWATNHLNKGWLVDRLELEANQHPNKRFLLRSKSTASDDPKATITNETTSQKPPAEGQKDEMATAPLLQPGKEQKPYVHTLDGGKMR